jgi:CRISPR type III-B/RAMP module RAMP protein Cmr6
MEAMMIPISLDVRQLVGDWAEAVDNRSLLHEKFALPKVWGVGEGGKLDNAGRWSVLRIVTRGGELLKKDANNSSYQAQKLQSTNPDKAERLERDGFVAEKMAMIARVDSALARVANENARRFLDDLDKSFTGLVVTFEATLGSRMMVNLAGGVVENAGIALDRCFGLPLIPGSAVKGITRVQALWEIREAKNEEKIRLLRLAMLLFGYGAHDLCGDFGWAGGVREAQSIADEIGAQDFKGCACFLPAYPTTAPTLVVDMVNPHYPQYYSGNPDRPCAEDNESPIPNYFPAVEAKSAFGFAALLNRVPNLPNITAATLLAQVKQWLERAITRKGVGAKTAAGYGWFELERRDLAAPSHATSEVVASTEQTTSASPADQVIARFKILNTKDNFPAALPQMVALASEADLRRAFETLVPAHERNKLRKNTPYWQAFTSGKAGADGQKILARLGLKLT